MKTKDKLKALYTIGIDLVTLRDENHELYSVHRKGLDEFLETMGPRLDNMRVIQLNGFNVDATIKNFVKNELSSVFDDIDFISSSEEKKDIILEILQYAGIEANAVIKQEDNAKFNSSAIVFSVSWLAPYSQKIETELEIITYC